MKTMFEIVYDEIVVPLMKQGFSDDEIITFMVQQDLPKDIAWMLLSNNCSKPRQNKKKLILPIMFEYILTYPPNSHPPSLQDASRYGPFYKGIITFTS